MPKLVDVIIVNRAHLPKTLIFYMILEMRRRRGGCASAGADAQAQEQMRKRRGGCASAGADAQAHGRLGWLKAWLVEGLAG